MKAFLVYALLTLALCANYAKEDNVIILTDDNFEQAIKEYPLLFVKFYAPWCGHCKKLAPEYIKAAETLSQENIIFGQVDATVQRKLGERFEIKGYPNLKLFINGVDVEFNGGRTEKDIVTWLRKKVKPVVKTLTTEEELDIFKSEDKVVVIYFGDNKEELSLFEIIGKSFDDIEFGACSVKAISEKYVKKGKIILFKSFDEKRNDYEETISRASLVDFVTKHSIPSVMIFNESALKVIFEKNFPGIFLYRDIASPTAKELEGLMTLISEKTKGKIQVVISGISDEVEKRLSEYIGITAANLPSIWIHDTRAKLLNYNLKGVINEKNILEFVDQWEKGQLEPYIKSEEIPTEQTGPVYKIVGKTFKDLVIKNNKDVLVKFYAPWCGHCKQLAPIYEKLAAKYKHNDKLIIAEVDLTENQIDEVNINSYPTLKLWAAGRKNKPIDFSGDRTLETLEKFLEEHVTYPFEIKSDL